MMVIKIGYKHFVVSNDDGIAMANIMSRAERYEEAYHSAERDVDDQVTVESHHTYHVWAPPPSEVEFEMKIINDEFVKMARVAGEPQD